MTLTGIAELKEAPAPTTSVVPVTRWEEIGQLATSLFDLRAAYEANLRTLTVMQRSLERIRRVDALAGEADLLLGEMARHLAQLEGAHAEIATHVVTVDRRLAAVCATDKAAP